MSTGFSSFETTVDKTNHILKEIERAYGWPKERRRQSYAALRVVLHVLRDRLTIEETAQFAAQLPLLVRGIYYEGWDPTRVPIKMDREEFVQRIRREFRYQVEGGVERLAHTVVAALRNHVSDGEWEDIRSNLPKELVPVLS